MSTRIKERGGGGSKIMASKLSNKVPLHSTPNDKRPVSAPRRSTVAIGKENPRDVSVGRVSSSRRKIEEKPAPPLAVVRFSTSSLPRGKSSKPPDLMSDVRGDRRLPRVSTSDQLGKAPGRDLEPEAGGRKSVGGIRVSGTFLSGKGLYDQGLMRNAERLATATGGVSYLHNPKPKGDTKSLDLIAEKLGRKSDGDLNAKGSSNSSKQQNEATFLEKKVKNLKESASLQTSKNKTFPVSSSNAIDGETTRCFPTGPKDSSYAVSNPKPQGQTNEIVAHATSNTKKEDCLVMQLEPSKDVGYDVKIKDIPCEQCVDSVPKIEVAHGRSANFRVFEKENDDVTGARIVSKYPSKLHEKLAMLEGKVQKIASEIKRTKEILDGNNPDDSKLILSDIQSQICGIEKAVSHAVRGTTSQPDSSKVIKANFVDQNNCVPGDIDQTIIPSYTVRELKNDVAEARFFPHHKLLRDRNSSGILGGHGSDRSDSDLEDGSSSSVGENPIAMKFLASLDLEQGEPSQHVNLASEHVTVQASGFERSTSTAEYSSKKMVSEFSKGEIELVADENFEEFDNMEKNPALMLHEQPKGPYKDQLCEIGQKPSTSGWFVSEGEAVLLTHHDGSCSYYDITNYEVNLSTINTAIYLPLFFLRVSRLH